MHFVAIRVCNLRTMSANCLSPAFIRHEYVSRSHVYVYIDICVGAHTSFNTFVAFATS